MVDQSPKQNDLKHEARAVRSAERVAHSLVIFGLQKSLNEGQDVEILPLGIVIPGNKTSTRLRK